MVMRHQYNGSNEEAVETYLVFAQSFFYLRLRFFLPPSRPPSIPPSLSLFCYHGQGKGEQQDRTFVSVHPEGKTRSAVDSGFA